MRYIKPLKGFRFTRNLGIFLFSTAVISGQLVFNENKAYGLDNLKLPPSLNFDSTEKVSVKKAEVSSTKKVEIKKEDTSTTKNNLLLPKPSIFSDNENSKQIENSSNNKDNLSQKTIIPPSLPSSFTAEDVVKESKEVKNVEKVEKVVVDNSTKNFVEKVEINQEVKTEVSALPVENKVASTNTNVESKSLKNVHNNFVIAKLPQKLERIDNNSKNTSSVNVEKNKKSFSNNESSEKKIENKKKDSVSSKNTSKKNRVKQQCPAGWDWFSAPLVFVKDANGKMVIKADKNAPKIVIPASNKNKEAVKADKKVLKQKKSSESCKSDALKEVKNKQIIEAPATQTCDSKDKLVEEKNIVKDIENDKLDKQVENEKANKIAEEVVVSKPWFTEAAEKMAKIKKFHEEEAARKAVNAESSIKANRSASMMKINQLVSGIIERLDNNDSELSNEELKNELVPQAPPEEVKNSDNTTDTVCENNKDNNNTFKPYINSRSRRHKADIGMKLKNLLRRR